MRLESLGNQPSEQQSQLWSAESHPLADMLKPQTFHTGNEKSPQTKPPETNINTTVKTNTEVNNKNNNNNDNTNKNNNNNDNSNKNNNNNTNKSDNRNDNTVKKGERMVAPEGAWLIVEPGAQAILNPGCKAFLNEYATIVKALPGYSFKRTVGSSTIMAQRFKSLATTFESRRVQDDMIR